MDNFENVTVNVCNEGKPCYLLGDFNINLLDLRSNNVAQFVNTAAASFFRPLIDRPTRTSSHSQSSLLDNVFTNATDMISLSGVLLHDISDHFPVFCLTSHKITPHNDKTKRLKRNMSPTNLDKFMNILSLESWSDVFDSSDPDNSYHSFISIYSKHYNNCFPLVKANNRSPRKDWCTPGIVNSCRTKDKLYKKYIKRPSQENRENYIRFRNKLNCVIRIAKRKFYFDAFSTSNQKGMWDSINSLINNKTPNSSVTSLTFDNNCLSDPRDISNAFNDYFINIGPNLARDIPDGAQNPINYMSQANASSFYMMPTDEVEVLNCISKLKHSSCGYDDISPKVVKLSGFAICKPLTHIINCSFIQGIFPSDLKIARVVPVFKSGTRDSVSNYRPISVLPCFSKIFEKLVFNRLYSFLVKHTLLYDYQFGFMPQRNTSQAILSLVDYVINSFENKCLAAGIFLDLSKAFDTLDHSILLNKLDNYGIRGAALSWFSSYIHNRFQYVSLSGVHSSKQTIHCGVPQGSILGPLLFLIYINDLPNATSKFHFILYADDTNLLHKGHDINTLVNDINTEIPKITSWFRSNKLHLNAKKSTTIIFHPKQKQIISSDLNIIIDNTRVPLSHSTKFLGVTLDENLTWIPLRIYARNSKAIGI